MFIGHLPAGYILTKKLQARFNFKKYLWLGLIASILPDLDILYFYFIDNRQTLHHEYWIHKPFYWLIIAIVIFIIVKIVNREKCLIAFYFFFSNIFLHLLLDSLIGDIKWFYPFSNNTYPIIKVDIPVVYDFWVYNFIFHWTFLFEILVVFLAIYVFAKKKLCHSRT